MLYIGAAHTLGSTKEQEARAVYREGVDGIQPDNLAPSCSGCVFGRRDRASRHGNIAYADDVLKIGVLGVMSGPDAAWGLVSKYSAEATAAMYNEQGGVEIGGKKYKVEIHSVDDQADPKLAVTGAQRLILQDGVSTSSDPTSTRRSPARSQSRKNTTR